MKTSQYVFVSGAGQANVSVRLPSLSMWMVTGVHGASGACAAGPVVLESSSDRGNVTTLRTSPVCLCICLLVLHVRLPETRKQRGGILL